MIYAQVHWVYPYERLRSPNVIGTLTAVELASTTKQKLFVFVSSTSAIDTEYYVRLSDSLSHLRSERRGVPEDDDLEGARTGLKTGYGQSKWVSEKLLFAAGKRGLKGHIVRPGYVVGDSKTAGARVFRPDMIHFLAELPLLGSNQHGRFHMADGQRVCTTWTRP